MSARGIFKMTPDEALALAWTRLAPNRVQTPDLPHGGFPRGFWQDVARVGIAIYTSGDPNCELSFRPTTAMRPSELGEPHTPQSHGTRRAGGKISSATKAANTAALLALLNKGATP